MAQPRDLRRRIRSISGTAQITRAMQMVAASKMRKAQQAAIAAGAVRAAAVSDPAHARRRGRRRLHASAARGARGAASARSSWSPPTRGCAGRSTPTCSALAAQFDPATRRSSSPPAARPRSSSRAAGRQLAAEFAYGDSPTLRRGAGHRGLRPRPVPAAARWTRCEIVATRFVNTLTQEPMALEYLPVGEITGLKVPGVESPRRRRRPTRAEIVFEPERGSRARLPARPLSQHLSSTTCC